MIMKDKKDELPIGDIRCIHEDCGYIWRPRVDSPKRCPKCQKWQDQTQEVEITNPIKK